MQVINQYSLFRVSGAFIMIGKGVFRPVSPR